MAKRRQTKDRAARKRKAAQKFKASRKAARGVTQGSAPAADTSELAAAGSGAAGSGTRTGGHAAAGAEAGSIPSKDIEAAQESDRN